MGWYDKKLARGSAYALRQALAAVRTGSGIADRASRALAEIEGQYLERIVTSFDGNEGIAAFLEKREPRWRDAVIFV